MTLGRLAVGLGILGSIGDNRLVSSTLLPDLPEPGELMDWSSVMEAALPYAEFLDRYATPSQRARWDAMHERIRRESTGWRSMIDGAPPGRPKSVLAASREPSGRA